MSDESNNKFRGGGGGNWEWDRFSGRRNDRRWWGGRGGRPYRPRYYNNYRRNDFYRCQRDRNDEIVQIRRDPHPAMEEAASVNYSQGSGAHESRENLIYLVNGTPPSSVVSSELAPKSLECKTSYYEHSVGGGGPAVSSTSAPVPKEEDNNLNSNLSYEVTAANSVPTYFSLEPLPLGARLAPPPPPLMPPTSFVNLKLECQKVIDSCITHFKARGDYDRIRRECLLDIDTKPAFLNVMEKVKDITNRFLETAQYHPNMDRARTRENLKKSFELSRTFQNGVESLVKQVLMPRISTILQPLVETEIRRTLGLIPDIEGANSEAQDELNSQLETGERGGSSQAPSAPQATCLAPTMNIIMDTEEQPKMKKPATFISTFTPVAEVALPSAEGNLQEAGLKELEEVSEPHLFNQSGKTGDEDKTISSNCSSNPTTATAAAAFKDERGDEVQIKLDEKMGKMSPGLAVFDKVPLANQAVGKSIKETVEELLIGKIEDDKDERITDEAEADEELEDEEIVGDEEGEYTSEEEEDDDDLESPAFEKIDEVSPVRIGPTVLVPIYEDKFAAARLYQQREQMKIYAQTNTSSLFPETKLGGGVIHQSAADDINGKGASTQQTSSADESSKVNGSNVAEVSQQNSCKFLEFNDKLAYQRKMLYFQRLEKLSPNVGKPRYIVKIK